VQEERNITTPFKVPGPQTMDY